jgi:hypothetical protein
MNWRRGLFRLWIVGTALFVLAIAFVSYSEINGPMCEGRHGFNQQVFVADKQVP